MKTIALSNERTKRNSEIETPTILPMMNIQMFRIKIVGDSSLICHKWAEKAKQEMLDKQTKKAKVAKAAKDPEQCFRDSLYYNEAGKPSFPAVAFKSAAVDACSHVEGITKVEARGAFHIQGDMIPIEGIATMRQDMVRIGMGTADIRFRGEFKQWFCSLTIRHNANVLSRDQIINLFNTAGFAVGIGEWRPQKDGSFGMFHCE